MPARPADEKGPIIVIVDDELDLLMALADHFRAALPDARVFPAESGPTALAFIQENPPDLVIMDWRMPGLNGLELADLLTLARRPPATILMTAHPSPGLAYKASSEHGFSAIFSKPFDPAVMVETALGLIKHRGPRAPRPGVAKRTARGPPMPSRFRTVQ